MAGWLQAEVNRQLSPVERGELARTQDAATPVAQPTPGSGPDPVQLGLDLTQMTLDITGIIEPTPIADGSNTVISTGRAIGSLFSGDWGGAGGHASNGTLWREGPGHDNYLVIGETDMDLLTIDLDGGNPVLRDKVSSDVVRRFDSVASAIGELLSTRG